MFDRFWHAVRHLAWRLPTSARSADEFAHRRALEMTYEVIHDSSDLPRADRGRPRRLVYAELNRWGKPIWRAA